MTCREVAEFLMEYLDGSLSPDSRARFDAHLHTCADCQAFLDQYRTTIAAERAAFADLEAEALTEVPEPMVQAILEGIKS